MTHGLICTAPILALKSMVGPLAIVVVLPAMPAIAADLATCETAAQGLNTVYFLAFGFAYRVNAPWAVMSGRKPPIHTGLAVFAPGFMGAARATCWARTSSPAAC